MKVIPLPLDREAVRIDPMEGLRYVGYRAALPSAEFVRRGVLAMERVRRAMTPRCCYLRVPVYLDRGGQEADLSVFRVRSRSLCQVLTGCQEAFLFAATTGAGVDREMNRAACLSAVDGVVSDAMGSAAIEGVCDLVCAELGRLAGRNLRNRFSPGYGDLPIALQPQLIAVLDAGRQIGLTLTGEMMMAPMKSVTAIVGIEA